MKKNSVFSGESGVFDRRSMVIKGVALAGTGFLGSMIKGPALQEQTGPIFNIRGFGASGKKEENATKAIRDAIEACTSAGGGSVLVPPGEYTTGTLQLKDNVNLEVSAGATLLLSQDPKDFIQGGRAMIYAENAHNISLTGKGTLDGLATYEFIEMRGPDTEISEEIEIARNAGIDMRRYYRTGMQTYMCILNNCKDVLLQDISIIHSPLWTVRLNDCDRAFIRGVYIFSDLEKGVNADGIDICSSKNVTISDSVIITADDSIVLKTPAKRGMKSANPCENILVTNCVLTSSSTALMIGTETFGDMKHIIFSNCTIRNSNKGFGINVQDGCTISDVIISNLTIDTSRRHWNWWGSCEMCKFVLKKREVTSKLGRIKNISVSNVIAHTRGTSTIKGHPEQPLENIRFDRIQMFMQTEDAKDKRATNAFETENVTELVLRGFSISWQEDETEKKWGSALLFRKVRELEIREFKGRQGLKESTIPAILLENVREGLIAESSATEGCSSFICIKGSETGDIEVRNNNVKKAKIGISFESEGLKKEVKIK